jgi:hypothetical protein
MIQNTNMNAFWFMLVKHISRYTNILAGREAYTRKNENRT